MRQRVAAADQEPKQIGTVGDEGFPEYDGGAVYCRVPESGAQTDIYGGDCFIEYVNIPPDDLDFEDPAARWTVYRVDRDPEVPSWIDLEDAGFDPDSIVIEANFGDAIAVNEDVLVGPEWAGILGVRANELWSEVGTQKLTDWLDTNGYEYLDKSGGRVPSAEGYAYAEHVIRAVAKELDRPIEQVEEAAESIDGWREEIPGSSSGMTYVWAKRKEGTETKEARRRSMRTRRK